jgi:hypothetical protein
MFHSSSLRWLLPASQLVTVFYQELFPIPLWLKNFAHLSSPQDCTVLLLAYLPGPRTPFLRLLTTHHSTGFAASRLLTLVTALHNLLSHRLVFPVTVLTALLGNVFQQWAFLCSRAHVLAGWQPSHTNLLLFELHHLKTGSLVQLVLGTDTQKTLLPTVLMLLHNITAVAESCLLCCCLATGDVYGDMVWRDLFLCCM